MRPPCLIYLSTSTTPRGVFARRGYIVISEIYTGINPGNRLMCGCLLHSRPSWDVRTATWYDSPATALIYAAAAVNCCHNTYATNATGQIAENAPRPATGSFHGPCLFCAAKIRAHTNKVSLGPACRASSLHALLLYTGVKKLKNVSCEYDRLNGWNSTLQAAWYYVYQTRSLDVLILYFIYIIVFVNLTYDIITTAVVLILSFTKKKMVRAFYKKLKNVSCEDNRVNGWNSTLQAAWYIRHVRIIWYVFFGLIVRYDY